jgi:hypothetical protein
MAHLTKTRFGYYINRQYLLPTSTGKAILGAIAQKAAQKSCACHGACGHCGTKGLGRRFVRRFRGLGILGDDSDSGYLDMSTGVPYDSEIGGETSTFLPIGASPTQTALFAEENFPTINFSGQANSSMTNLTSGSSSSAPSWWQSLFGAGATIAASAIKPNQQLTPAQQLALAQQSQLSPLSTPIAGIGLSPLMLGGIALGVVVLVSVAKGGRRR